ncbi:MAG: hypothetical protein QM831_44055 [Kofleriaceae bacterium]
MTSSDARRGNLLGVETMRDRRQGPARQRIVEDALDDPRLAFFDLDLVRGHFAAIVGHGNSVIPVRDVSCGEAGERLAFESAQCLVPEIVQVHLAHQALERKRHLRARRRRVDPVRDTDEWNLFELEPLENHRRVGEVA